MFTAQTLALCLSQEMSWKSVVTFSLVLRHKMALLSGKLLETSFRWSLSLIYPSSLLKFASPCPINCTWVGLVIVCQRSKQSKTNSDDIQSSVKTFLRSSQNHPQNVWLPTPKMHYMATFKPTMPKTWQECFYTTLYSLLTMDGPQEMERT